MSTSPTELLSLFAQCLCGLTLASTNDVSRGPRLDAPDALHHVLARGMERRRIFRSDADRRRFVDRLGRVMHDGGAIVYAWSLLPNHFHVLLRTGTTRLSLLMQRLLTGHAVTFNRRYHRSGHLFQNRFKSILVEDEAYLLELVRYIHLNPIRAGVLTSLDELDNYRWTGHAAILGAAPPPPWQGVAAVLGLFNEDADCARRRYQRFLADGVSGVAQADLKSDGLVPDRTQWRHVRPLRRGREAWAFAERILGRRAFVDAVASVMPVQAGQLPHAPTESIDIPGLMANVAACLNLLPEEIARPGGRRTLVAARTCVAYVLVRHGGFSLTRAAKVLGTSKWSIARAVQRSSVALSNPAHPLAKLLRIVGKRENES